MINNIRVIIKSAIKALPCFLISTVLASADTLFNSEWSNPDGSKSESTVTFYQNIGPDGKIGHYAGSAQNRLVGKYSSDYTVFEGYWVQDDSSQQCSYKVDGSQFYGRVFLTSSDGKEFDGLWGYCDEAPNLRWQGWIAAVQEQLEEKPQPANSASREVIKQIQEGLNWFGYPAGTPDGLAGKKTRNAIEELQRCWQAVDPDNKFIPRAEKLGSLSKSELTFFKSHYYTTSTMRPRIYFDEYNSSGFTACEYFEAVFVEATGMDINASGMPPGQCYAEGDKAEPLFYCTFSGGKNEVSLCEELDEDAESEEDRNTISYNFGKYNSEPDMYIYEKIEKVFVPTEDYTYNNVPMDTSSDFAFLNGDTRYVITANTWMHTKGRGFDATLTVIGDDKILAKLNCDEGSIIDNSWDGAMHERLAQGKENSKICEGKYTGYALKNNLYSKLPEEEAGYSWSELMKSNTSGSLLLSVKGSEEARYKLDGFDRSMALTKMNEGSIDNGGPILEECFGDWCSVCDTWPGTDQTSCYTIHDVNRSGLMLAFDSGGRAAIHEECYPKISYPCSFAGQLGESISVEMELYERSGSSAKMYGTGTNEWALSCY